MFLRLGSQSLRKIKQPTTPIMIMVVHFRKFPALENFSCWKFTRWKSVAGNAGKMEKF